jgi:hypothetical protein
MSTRRIMRIVSDDGQTIRCQACGYGPIQACLRGGGRFYRGAWQCPDGCRWSDQTIVRLTTRPTEGRWNMSRSYVLAQYGLIMDEDGTFVKVPSDCYAITKDGAHE